MTELNWSAQAAYATSAALAHVALLTHLLRHMVAKGILAPADVEQILADATAHFQHPQATEFEGGAVGIIMSIRDRMTAP